MANNLDVKLRIDTAVEGLAAIEQLVADLKSLVGFAENNIPDPMAEVRTGAEKAAKGVDGLKNELTGVSQAKIDDPTKPLQEGVKQADQFVEDLVGQMKALGATGDLLEALEGFIGGLASGMTKAADEADDLAGGLGKVDGAGKGVKRLANDAKQAGDNFGFLNKMAKSALGVLAGYLSFRGLQSLFSSFTQLSSEYTDLDARLKNVTASTAEADMAMQRIKETADRTYASIGSTADIFLENALAFNDLGYSASQQLDFMSAMTDALVVSGAKGQQAETVIRALSKALMEGVLKGDNWNTVLRSGGRVVQALADGLGVTIDQLRNMASEGQLSSAKVFQALMSQMEALKRESEAMPATINDAFVKLGNQILFTVGELDKVNDVSQKVVANIDEITRAIRENQTTIGDLVSGVAWLIDTLIRLGSAGTRIVQASTLGWVAWGKTVIATGEAISQVLKNLANPFGRSVNDIFADYQRELRLIGNTTQELWDEIWQEPPTTDAAAKTFGNIADAARKAASANKDFASTMESITGVTAKVGTGLEDSRKILAEYTKQTKGAAEMAKTQARINAEIAYVNLDTRRQSLIAAGDVEAAQALNAELELYLKLLNEVDQGQAQITQWISAMGETLNARQLLDLSTTIGGHEKAKADFEVFLRQLELSAQAARAKIQDEMENLAPGSAAYAQAQSEFEAHQKKLEDYARVRDQAVREMDAQYYADLKTTWEEQERGEKLSSEERAKVYLQYAEEKWKIDTESVAVVKQAKIDEQQAVIDACNAEIKALQEVGAAASLAGQAILWMLQARQVTAQVDLDAKKAELAQYLKDQEAQFAAFKKRMQADPKGGGAGKKKKAGGKSAAVREAEKENKALEAETKRRAEAERKIQEEALRAALGRGEIDIRDFMTKKAALAQEAADSEVAIARAALDRIRADRKASQSDLMKAETDLMIAENNAPKQYQDAYKEAFDIVAQEHSALQTRLQQQVDYTKTQIEAGFLSQAQGQRQIKAQVEETLPVLESMVEQYEAMVAECEKLGIVIPGVTEKLLEMKSVNLQNKQVMNQTANEINAVFEGALSSALSNVADQWNDLIGLARTFIKTILDGIAQIMAKNIASSLATSMGMGGGGGGIGGWLSGLLGFAGGGAVDGPGTSTSDSIVARLSRGEYVINARAVRLLGRRFLDALNNVHNPGVFMQPSIAKFAAGGLVSPTLAGLGEANPAGALAAANIGFTVENTWDRDGFITHITRNRRFRQELIRAAGEEKKAFRNIIG